MTGESDGIVAGYDGSPGAEEALRWAVREAWARGTVLTVCFAWSPEYLALLGVASAGDIAERTAGEILAQGARYAGDALGREMTRQALGRGPAAGVLCERSETAEMVVTGSRGHGGVAGQRLGSVARQVAAHGHGPVVVVRGQWHAAGHAQGPVAVGLDQSPASHAVAEFAFREARLHQVPLLAVCALADAPGLLGCAREMEADFSHAITLLEKEHPDVPVLRQVAHGSPREALLAAAAGAQLLVVGSRGRGGIRGMSLGSVTQAVLQHAPCPVAVVRPRGDRRGSAASGG